MKTKFMAIAVVLALVLSLVLALAGPVSASSPSWNVSGTWGISFVGTNGEFGTYTYSVTLVQTGTSITGSGTLTSTLGSPVLDDIAGSVSGNTINFSGDYGTYWAGNFSAEGTIASGGTMSGTWTQSPTGGAVVYSGTWTTTSGHATPVFAPITASGNVIVQGAMVAPTIGLTVPSGVDFGQFKVGDNYAQSPNVGTVTFAAGSDQSAQWTLQAYSMNDGAGADYSSGLMYSPQTLMQLTTPMKVSFDNAAWGALSGGVTTALSNSASFSYYLYAYQSVTTAEVLNGSGTYYMIVNLMATVTP